jgi:hypothetical protein
MYVCIQVHLLQEVVVLQYLRLLLLAVDDIGEARYVPIFRRMGVLVLGCKLLLLLHTRLPEAVLLQVCHALSLLAETEDFSTYKPDYLGNVNVPMHSLMHHASCTLLPSPPHYHYYCH